MTSLGMPWNLTEAHGWGLVGVHTSLYLIDRGTPPVLLAEPMFGTMRPQTRERLMPLLETWRGIAAWIEQNKPPMVKLGEVDVLHPLGNGMVTHENRFQGRRNIGVIAFENTRLDERARAAGRSYDFMIAHSEYNVRLLQDAGIPDVRLTWQGIDPTEMYPVTRRGVFGNRFVVFSGGKLEFRKGQDLVVAAFRQFHQRHPDSLLVSAWFNAWPAVAMDMTESKLAPAPPRVANGRVQITRWAVDNGMPPEAFFDLGFLSRDRIANVLAECDAALFPNRCEGATNLVAMEAMACGLPVVISANTGHRDIIRDGACYPLLRQDPVPDPKGERQGWGESSVEEIVETLEAMYQNREEARRRGAAGMEFIQKERTWRKFAEAFVEAAER
ncbi:MAG: glycosyltransferase family 4 protein [Alphaproteobacteria bacterium]|nr:glycosyltransferase family 4 protein [Alphaproteobacteria bacterium]